MDNVYIEVSCIECEVVFLMAERVANLVERKVLCDSCLDVHSCVHMKEETLDSLEAQARLQTEYKKRIA